MGIPLVATNDAHYLTPTDAPAQDALVCISTGKNISDTERIRYIDAPTFYLRDEDEMRKIFSDFPDSLDNSLKIAEKCDLSLELGKSFYPQVELPAGKTAPEVLKDLADGSSYGVQGTPGFFINGKPLSGAQPYSAFKQVIDAELQ